MKRIIPIVLFLLLPLAAWSDGMVVPSIADPAQVTIPDQQALIGFSNGVERLVIETRFTGAGTNFAWVVPLPSQPVIEAATTGLFPTLRYLLRPEIVHKVPRYYIGILCVIGFGFLYSQARKSLFTALLSMLLLLTLAGVFLPTLSATKSMGIRGSYGDNVSILDRKMVGVYETVTITSRDARALSNWLRDNGYAVSAEAGPVLHDYVKDGWVFVCAKIRRDDAGLATGTPQPLSFRFKTDKPVYPMRLTGLNSQSLAVDLYVLGETTGTAPHFHVEKCIRRELFHPLLRQWFGSSAVLTKLTAILSPADMRQDVWLNFAPAYSERVNRLYSRQGALIVAANWGAGVLAAGLLVCAVTCAGEAKRRKLSRRIGQLALITIAVFGLTYLSLPKIEVNLVSGYFSFSWREQRNGLDLAWKEHDWHTAADARADIRHLISNAAEAGEYGLRNMTNYFVGGQVREEDSPGNYLLRETNSQLQLIFFDANGGEIDPNRLLWQP